jgi:DNA-binding MarR family transcriptional regulator
MTKVPKKSSPEQAADTSPLPNGNTLDRVHSAAQQWRHERPGYDASFFEVVVGFSLIYQQMIAEFRAFSTSELDMGEGDVRILLALRRTGPEYAQSPVNLKNNLFVTAGAITKQIDRLEKRGLVERAPHPTSRKSVLIHLTEAGAALVDRIHEDNQPFALLHRAFDGLSVDEQHNGRRFLRRMMGRLETVRNKD